MQRILLSGLLLCCTHLFIATDLRCQTLVLDDELRKQEVISLENFHEFWVDSSATQTIQQVRQQSNFVSPDLGQAFMSQWALQNFSAPLWMRVSILNATSESLDYYLSIGLHAYSEVFVYRNGQQVRHEYLGNLLSLDKRPVDILWPSTNNNSMLLELPPGVPLTIYAKIQNPYGPNMYGKNSQFRASLIHPDYLELSSNRHLLSAIFCQGALWFILIFQLVNFVINRTQLYLWYCMFLFAIILHLLDSDFILLYLYPQAYPPVADYLFIIIVGLIFICYFQFSKVVMQSTNTGAWAARVFTILIRTQIIFFTIWLIIYSLNRFVLQEGQILWLVIAWHSLYQLLIVSEIVTVIALNVLLVRKAHSNVIRYYVAANSYMAFVLALHFLLPFVLAPGNEVGGGALGLVKAYTLETSILGQVLLFSIALAFVIKEKEQRMERSFANRLARVEMQSLRSRMNPHFLFNCLNSINRYVVGHQPAEASDYLTRFAKLIRIILQNSKSPLVLLSEEMESLRLYIEMESLRFERKFTYEMIMSDDIQPDHTEIPPMLIQPYVENAIWHGLMHKEEGVGHLRMELKREGDVLICSIEDNGIGRERAAAIRRHMNPNKKSMGMNITSERLKLLERQKGIRAEVEVVDLVAADGSALGTRVIISMSS